MGSKGLGTVGHTLPGQVTPALVEVSPPYELARTKRQHASLVNRQPSSPAARRCLLPAGTIHLKKMRAPAKKKLPTEPPR